MSTVKCNEMISRDNLVFLAFCLGVSRSFVNLTIVKVSR